MRKSFWIFLLLLIISFSATEAQDFDACGVLYHGVEAGCIIFDAGNEGSFLVDNIWPYSIGDTVRIVGTIWPGCITTCMQGPCLIVQEISSCDATEYLDACGVLYHGVEAGCIIFDAGNEGSFLVDNIWPYSIGDTVRIIGTILPDCETFCMQGPCLQVQQITECQMGCCGLYTSGLTGNIDCDTAGKRSLADITRLIDRVYVTRNPLCCEDNGNVDGDQYTKMNLADITRLIDHVYGTGSETALCH